MLHSNFLLSDFDSQFLIYPLSHLSLRRYRVIPEYLTHVVEQTSDRQHDRGWFQIIPAVQEELSVLVYLRGGLSELVVSLAGFVLRFGKGKCRCRKSSSIKQTVKLNFHKPL